jgi:hypothetical protein
MARYFFAVQGTIQIDDTEGMDLPNVDAAFDEAIQNARVLLEDGIQIGRNRADWRIHISSEGGNAVGDVRLGDAAIAA